MNAKQVFMENKDYWHMLPAKAAKALGVKEVTIRGYRNLVGLTSPNEKQIRAKEGAERLLRELDQTCPHGQCMYSTKEMAKRYGLSPWKVGMLFAENGVEPLHASECKPWADSRPRLSAEAISLARLIDKWAVPEGLPEHVKELRRANV